LTVSASECAVSASIALDPVIRPAASFATAMIPLETIAMLTVRRVAASAWASGTLRRLTCSAVVDTPECYPSYESATMPRCFT
jgi:hypothetical protein